MISPNLSTFRTPAGETIDLGEGIGVRISRFGSAVNLNVHYHTLALDGVFTRSGDGRLRFHPAMAPSDAEGKAKDPGRVSYKEVNISNRKAATVSLVTTFREKGRLLRDLGTYLQSVMESDMSTNRKDFSLNALGEVGHSIVGFDKLPTDRLAEEEIELPHKATREGLARKRLVSPQSR